MINLIHLNISLKQLALSKIQESLCFYWTGPKPCPSHIRGTFCWSSLSYFYEKKTSKNQVQARIKTWQNNFNHSIQFCFCCSSWTSLGSGFKAPWPKILALYLTLENWLLSKKFFTCLLFTSKLLTEHPNDKEKSLNEFNFAIPVILNLYCQLNSLFSSFIDHN